MAKERVRAEFLLFYEFEWCFMRATTDNAKGLLAVYDSGSLITQGTFRYE
jgi:hypothetical protein